MLSGIVTFFYSSHTCHTKIAFLLADKKFRCNIFKIMGWVVIEPTNFTFCFSDHLIEWALDFFCLANLFHCMLFMHTSHILYSWFMVTHSFIREMCFRNNVLYNLTMCIFDFMCLYYAAVLKCLLQISLNLAIDLLQSIRKKEEHKFSLWPSITK